MMATRRRTRVAGLSALVLIVVGAGLVSAASGGWTIARSPSSVTRGVATNISFTATNVAGGSSLGCIRLQPPSAFTLNSVVVDSVSASRNWTADPPTAGSGFTLIRVHAATKADVIKVDGDIVRFHVRVTGTSVGSYSWPAESRDDEKCKSGIDTDSITVAIVSGTPTPKPTPKPTPRPTATPTPRPTPKPTPRPTPKPTRAPAATSRPSATPTTAPSTSVPTPSSHPVGGTSTGDAGGTGSPPLASGSVNPFRVLDGDDGPRDVDARIVSSTLMRLDGLIVWAVPSLVLTVPGLLLLLAILAQIAGAAAWLPVVRRKLGAFGLGRGDQR
jgi:hypothetical protein